MKITTPYVLLCASLLGNVSPVSAGPLEFYFKKKQEEQTSNRSLIAKKFSQLITHKDPKKGTFTQRYYVDETYGPSDSAPVFFYICGESSCNSNVFNGAIRRQAQKFGAKMVALEHRYYGNSVPTKTLSTKDLAYLTTEEALEDLAYFQTQMIADKEWTGRWIAYGGGYAGSLAAYYRSRFPNLVAGALASSAPVKAKQDFIEYDATVTASAGPECADLIQNVVYEVQSTLTNKIELSKMKMLFDATGVKDSVDFLSLIADVAASSIQYGRRDEFCQALATSTTALEGYAQYARKLYKELGATAVQLTPQGAKSTDPDEYRNGFGLRQWYYQTCTEYGYWQNANPNPFSSTRSLLIDNKYHQGICKRLFDRKDPPNTALTNDRYYDLLQSNLTSHIYFTNGDKDPWFSLSLTKDQSLADVDYYVIKGGAHCQDLLERTAYDSKSLKYARTFMELEAQTWLVGCS